MSLCREETIKIPFYFCFNHFDKLKQLEGYGVVLVSAFLVVGGRRPQTTHYCKSMIIT